MNAKLLELIEHIYQAATEPDEWLSVLEDIGQYFDAVGGNLHILNGDDYIGEIGLTTYATPEQTRIYNEKIAPIDPWNQKLAQLPVGTPFHASAQLPVKEWVKTEAYQEFYVNTECFHGIGSFFFNHDNKVGMLGINRTKSCKDFTPDNVDHLAKLLPHLNRAFLIQNKIVSLEQKYNTALDALNFSPFGIMLLDASKEVVFYNAKVESLIQKKAIKLIGNVLNIADREKQNTLDRLIHNSCSTFDFDCMSAGGGISYQYGMGEDKKLFFAVYPYQMSKMQSVELGKIPKCIILISENNPATVSTDMLRDLFGLTAAESRTLQLLMKDYNVEEMSEHLSISKNAVRFQLKSLFRKTGVRSQVELINLSSKVISRIVRD